MSMSCNQKVYNHENTLDSSKTKLNIKKEKKRMTN